MADDAFKPKRLPTRSVEAPLQRRWQVMGDDEAKKLHRRAQDEAERFSFTGPRTRRRCLRYLVLTPIGFAILGWFFVGSSLHTVGMFLLVGLPLGGLMMAVKPGDYLCGVIYGLCGLAAIVASGHLGLGVLSFPTAALGTLGIGTVGMALGRVEESRRFDGTD